MMSAKTQRQSLINKSNQLDKPMTRNRLHKSGNGLDLVGNLLVKSSNRLVDKKMQSIGLRGNRLKVFVATNEVTSYYVIILL